MATAFDASTIERHGWRQGAVLGANLSEKARTLAPLLTEQRVVVTYS